MTHRVVVTGFGAYSPIVNDWQEVESALRSRKNGVCYVEEWAAYDGLNTRLGAPVTDFEMPSSFTRKKVRSMGRVSLLATAASEKALVDAGLLDDPILQSGKVGIAYGSSSGSTDAIADFANMLISKSLDGITATTYIRMMGHTAPVNVGVFFWSEGSRHHDVERLHIRQPGHRLRLRGDSPWIAGPHACRWRRGIVPDPGGCVRYLVRNQYPQRHAGVNPKTV